MLGASNAQGPAMPMTVVQSNIITTAYMIPQEYTVRTISARRVGTSGMFNCMGVVLHSPAHHIGCLAHIEAMPTDATYLQMFQTYIVYMRSKIIKYGGNDAGMQAALFGNMNGSTSQALTTGLKTSLVMCGIASTQITDQRNQTGGGPFYDAGVVARINANFPSIAYDPATGTVECFSALHTPTPSANTTGIRRKKLQ
ncbi:MAG: hypothetical protein BGP12_10790 [Rhodospirillales bacterium 70-18]|nr:MAG: hypothetical protein BGP12_10790 [Rhodospirillales bacterium 70-18]